MARLTPALHGQHAQPMTRIPESVAPHVQAASEAAGSDVHPFWLCDSEGTAEEGMYQLATELDVENAEQGLGLLPAGYRIVHSIFLWEQSRAGGGFVTGTGNAGAACVEAAASSYESMDMREEAAALRAMLAQRMHTPHDHARGQAAYDAVPNPYRDDWDRIPTLVRRLCEQAEVLLEVA